MTEILHYPGSLDEPRDIETDDGNVEPITNDPDLSSPVGDMWPDYRISEDEPEDTSIPMQIAKPALFLASRPQSERTPEEEKMIEDYGDKRGLSYPEAEKILFPN